MSWVRWGYIYEEGEQPSSLYIYDDVKGGVICCDCSLMPDRDFTCRTIWGMKRHIRKHKKAGHNVPGYLLERGYKPWRP